MIDRIRMGPLTKYQKYHVFPWELLIHLCIVCFSTLQIMAMVETTGAYSRGQANLFFFKMLNHDDDQDSYNKQDIQYLNNFYRRSELRSFVQESIANYFQLTNYTAMERYELVDETGHDYPITARYFYLSNEYNETSCKDYDH